MKNYALAIPSRNRADWLRSKKRTTLNQTHYFEPHLWIRTDETEDSYQSYCHYMLENNMHPADWMVRYDGSEIFGAAQTYDHIINFHIARGDERLIILDDDLYFSMHNPIPEAKPDFKLCNKYELDNLLNHFANLTCPQLPAMSMTHIISRTKPRLIDYGQRFGSAYSFYLPHFRKHPEHRFWHGKQIEARCDLNLALQLLTDGFLTAWLASIFVPCEVNNPGGCSTYRDLQVEEMSTEYILTNYPHVAKARMKRGWMGDDSIVRKTLFIHWKQAMNHHKFWDRFGIEAREWSKNHLLEYEKVYADFIRSIRNAS